MFPWYNLVPIRMDGTSDDVVIRAAAGAHDVTLLINNAGINHNTAFMRAPNLAMAREEIEANYLAPLRVTRAFAPALIAELEPYRGEIIGLPANVMQGATSRFRAPLLALLGRRDEAIEELHAAIALEEQLGAEALLVRSRRWLARITAS